MSENTFKAELGKNVVETLTLGMYDDPRYVFREYIQNSADQIDKGIKEGLFKDENPQIEITIDVFKKELSIYDNATGIISSEVQLHLGNIAQSSKNRFSDKGFRGIGRLGGLAYCDVLIFETSFKGEATKSKMIWDAKQLKEIIESTQKVDASELISAITAFEKTPANKETHYFKVTLEGVTNDLLLNEKKVREYLSMVAPVPFAKGFSFKDKIFENATNSGVVIDDYNILLNHVQLFKLYKNDILKGGVKFDSIQGVDFFSEQYDGGLLYWGWYGRTGKLQRIPDENIERSIRLRKSNIQIGLENVLDLYHKESRGNEYFIGEVYAINKNLIPNSRRDFFMEDPAMLAFKTKLGEFFKSTLYNLYYDYSKRNGYLNTLKEYSELQTKFQEKQDSESFENNEEYENLSKKVNEKLKKAKKAKTDFDKLVNKHKDDPFGKIFEDSSISKIVEFKEKPLPQIADKQIDSENRLNLLNETQKELLSFIFKVIKAVQSKSVADNLVKKIEEEINEKYTPN